MQQTVQPPLPAPHEAAANVQSAWLRDLDRQRRARAAHIFLLYLNVSDYVFDGTQPPLRLVPYLVRYLRECGYTRIGTCSLSGGLYWHEASVLTTVGNAGTTHDSNRAPLPSSAPSSLNVSTILRRLERDLSRVNGTRVGVIVENIDYLAPHSTGGHDRESTLATEILTRLALNDGLRAAGVVLIGLCRSPEAVAPALTEAAGGVVTIKIPLPNPAERRQFLHYLASPGHAVELARLASEFSVDSLVNLTQGFPLTALDALNRAALVSQQPISYSLVRERKKEAIEKQSKGMLEEIEPRYGFEAIGGLAHIVTYLRSVVTHICERRLEAIPKGILLAGPPGTGKTLIAEALAKEAGFNLIRMGDVRSMWVGESERNLSHVLRLLLELEPVVVFVDEVDQAMGARDRGFNGDSGVSARIFGRILNFMGKNEHRGRVMWIAATNRPDFLDEAMIRRFDRVFPFFVPGAAEREKILRVMPRITGCTYAPDIHLHRVGEHTEGLTGSALEVITRRAAEIAGGDAVTEADLLAAIEDYKPNHDPDAYLLQSLLALNATNLFSALPSGEDLPEEIRRIINEMRAQCSAAPLHARIRELRLHGVR